MSGIASNIIFLCVFVCLFVFFFIWMRISFCGWLFLRIPEKKNFATKVPSPYITPPSDNPIQFRLPKRIYDFHVQNQMDKTYLEKLSIWNRHNIFFSRCFSFLRLSDLSPSDLANFATSPYLEQSVLTFDFIQTRIPILYFHHCKQIEVSGQNDPKKKSSRRSLPDPFFFWPRSKKILIRTNIGMWSLRNPCFFHI